MKKLLTLYSYGDRSPEAISAKREYQREYRRKNPTYNRDYQKLHYDKGSEAYKRWYQKNREWVLAYKREYRRKKKEGVV